MSAWMYPLAVDHLERRELERAARDAGLSAEAWIKEIVFAHMRNACPGSGAEILPPEDVWAIRAQQHGIEWGELSKGLRRTFKAQWRADRALLHLQRVLREERSA